MIIKLLLGKNKYTKNTIYYSVLQRNTFLNAHVGTDYYNNVTGLNYKVISLLR